MSFWTAIVIIVAIVSVAEIIKSKHRSQRLSEERRKQESIGSAREDPMTQREIEELRERIKVLERIATDGNSLDATETRRISQEIEALRDRQQS